MEAHFFQVDLEWLKDRKGEMTSPQLEESITVATPPQFPKGMAGIWSRFGETKGFCLNMTYAKCCSIDNTPTK